MSFNEEMLRAGGQVMSTTKEAEEAWAQAWTEAALLASSEREREARKVLEQREEEAREAEREAVKAQEAWEVAATEAHDFARRREDAREARASALAAAEEARAIWDGARGAVEAWEAWEKKGAAAKGGKL